MSREITISTAAKRTETRWTAEKYWWPDFVRKLGSPARGEETLEQYLAMSKAEQDKRKDVGGFVGGALKDGRRKAANVLRRDLITLDLDSIPAMGVDDTLRRIDSLGVTYVVYSTRKHEPARPRLRAIFLLAAPCSPDEYEPIARYVAAGIAMERCDPTTFEASRLMYWPSCCANSQYVYYYNVDRPMLDGRALLALHPDWHDVNTWPRVPGEEKQIKHADKLGDPTAKDGLVGAFCKAYDIHRAVAELLPGIYLPTDDPDRLTYAAGSTAGGAVVYDNGMFLYSHHATDPCSGREVNSFDLVRLHKYGNMDDDCPPGHPHNRLPSYQSMCEFCVSLPEVATSMQAARYEQAVADFLAEGGSAAPAAPGPDGDTSWLQKLAMNKSTGTFLKTLDNVVLILENDPLLKDVAVFDDFSQRIFIRGSFPWKHHDGRRRIWNEFDDVQLLRYVEKVYGITGKDRVLDGLKAYLGSHSINEVRDYLVSLQWDKVCRLDTLLIDYLGAEDTPYVRAVTRKAFCAAVARVMTPGVKYDYVPILHGPQGIGKSSVLAIMGGAWYSDSLDTFEGKEAAELLQGAWVIELGELAALNRSDMESVKHFVSKLDDQYREPYGRRVCVFPRHCVFFGTTNRQEHLRDTTGNRRWWPIDCNAQRIRKSTWNELPRERDQIWAEAMTWWSMAEPLRLPAELEAVASVQQFEHMETDPRTGMVAEWLDRPLPAGWMKRSIGERLIYWGGEFGTERENPVGTEPRRTVSRQEIWTECLHQDSARFSRRDAAEIDGIMAGISGWRRHPSNFRNGPYGFEKGFERCQPANGDS